MPGQFISPDGDLEKIFVDDYAMIDQYAKTGSLWLWGQNNYGQLGDSTVTNKSSPVQTIAGGTDWKQVTTGRGYTSTIKIDGTLWLWGYNNYGQLGDNTTANKSSPVQTIAGGTSWKQIACGVQHISAIKTDGTLWLWGKNKYWGALGDNTTVSRSSPVQTIAGGTNWKLIAAGRYHNASIKTDGTLWLWGRNQYGQLGDNTAVNKSSPVQTIAAGTNWKWVACGNHHTAAIKTDGTLWLWGQGNNGALGDNTTAHKSSPIQTIAGGTNWKLITAGGYYTSAIKTDGTLWTWGNNLYGQLGDNTTANKSSPVQTIAAGTNWKQISCGNYHTAAIKTDGTLWLWGQGNNSALGDNTTANKSSPVQTIAAGTNWKQVSANASNFGSINTAAVHFYDAGNLYPSA